MNEIASGLRHEAEHAGAAVRARFQPAPSDSIRVGSRRWFLQTGVAGIAGLSLAQVCRMRALAAATGSRPEQRAVILFWLSGGPSHLDFWDPKPDAPVEIRGPFDSIATTVPGVRFCEHLPLQASIMDRLSVIRSVDCRASDDHRAAVMQTGNSLAQKELQLTGAGVLRGRIPSMGSLVAKFRGANVREMPPFVGLGDPAPSLWHSDIWGAGHLGAEYEPISETDLAGRLQMPKNISVPRAQDRDELRRQFDRLRKELDNGPTMARMDVYARQAIEMVLSGKAQEAFRLDREPDAMRELYGRDSFGEKTLLARRLVEAGVTFIVVSGRFGVFDNHGDDVVWGGLIKGLKPLFPSVDRSLYALVTDLEARGLLDSTLILAMGEFGRSPQISQTGGRTHWTNCMSVLAAGGRGGRGQTIGSTDDKGYDVKEGRVIPADIAATVYRHLNIDFSSQWIDPQGRPHSIVADGGMPIAAL